VPDEVLYEVERGRARIILNRPEKHNAVARSMSREVHDRLWEADDDTSVHSVIIKGAGPSFCSGADLTDYRMEDDQPDARRRALTSTIDDDIWQIERGQRVNIAPFDVHKPVIAQVHGHCLALGTVIALFCDFVICAEDARFGFPPARDLGTLPSNMWPLNRFGWPAARRRSVSSRSGVTKVSTLSAWQWSVWSAT